MPQAQHPEDISADASPEGQPPPIPDEDGPHDVPDDKVIEKTLPAVPVAPLGSDPSSNP